MNVFRDGVIAFFSAVGMTTVVWLLAGMFSGGGGDVAPFLLGLLAVGAVLAGAVCLKDKLDRMEETLKAVSKTLQEVKTELETVKGRQEVAEIKLDTVAAKLGISRED